MRTNSENSLPWNFSIAELPRELRRQNVFRLSQLVRQREGLGGAHIWGCLLHLQSYANCCTPKFRCCVSRYSADRSKVALLWNTTLAVESASSVVKERRRRRSEICGELLCSCVRQQLSFARRVASIVTGRLNVCHSYVVDFVGPRTEAGGTPLN